TGEQSVGVFSGELHSSVLDTGFFAGSFVEHGGVHALALGPAQVHAEKDGGPVLRFGAAGAGLDSHDGAEVIVFAGVQGRRFEAGDEIFGADQLAIEILEEVVALLGVGFFAGEGDVGFDVAGERLDLAFGSDLVFGALAIAQNGLRGGLVVPEIGRGDAG